MSEAPERIWALPALGGDWTNDMGVWATKMPKRLNAQYPEYIRADLHEAETARLRAELAQVLAANAALAAQLKGETE
jgi:hypothetical protein